MFQFRNLLLRAPRLSPTMLAVSGFSAFSFSQLYPRRLVLNEPVAQPVSIAQYTDTGNGKTRLNGRLDYHQLTYGSFLGMVTGYLFGRVSRLLVGWIVTTLMGAEYLSSAGYIDVKPLETAIYNWGSRNLNQELLVNDPSFKYSYLLSFIVAAYYA